MKIAKHDPDQKIKYSTREFLQDLTRLIKPQKRRFFLASIFRFIGDVVNLYQPYALATIVTFLSNYSTGTPLTLIWQTLFLWLLMGITRSVCLFLSRYYGFQVGELVALSSEMKTISHLFNLDMTWQEKENSGNKLQRINNASNGIDRVMRIWINNLIEIIVNLFGTIFILSRFDFNVSLIVISFIVTYYLISHVLIKYGVAASYKVHVAREEQRGLMFEAISNIRSVKVMGASDYMLKMLSQVGSSLLQKIRLRVGWFQTRWAVLFFWGQVFRIGSLAYIIWGIAHGQYEVGFLVLFYGYYERIWESIRELSDVSQDLAESKTSMWRIKEVLNERINIDDESNKKEFPADWQHINIENLSFSYGSDKVLDNLTFQIKRGQKIGIVGLSGAGKSTLFKLLLMEWDNYDGKINLDETPLKQISKKSYFKHASVVLQDTEVFNFSLQDNITLVNPDQSHNKKLIKTAMDVAHVTDYLKRLPKGADTLIGEKGFKLSGGERQRLGIARAVFKQPQILFLDEATSHLDLESEEKIKDSLDNFFENVTAIVIAHRLTTIKKMDMIIVLENGKLIETGTFSELQRKKGRFYELWEKQKL